MTERAAMTDVLPPSAGNPLVAVAAVGRLEQRVGLFLTIAVYVTAAMALVPVIGSRPGWLNSPPGLASVALIVAYLILFQATIAVTERQHSRWLLAGLFAALLAVLATLQSIAAPFSGLALPLLALLMGVLPARRWPIAIAGMLVLAGFGWDIYGSIARGEIDQVATFLGQWLLWTGLFAAVVILLRQSERLAAVIQELHAARQALERRSAQDAELAALRERTRLAREMHDSLGHALVTVNAKLEVAERLYRRDPDRGTAELHATRDLVRGAMGDLRRSLADLRSPVPGPVDLPADLAALAAAMSQRSGVSVRADVPPEASRIPDGVARTLMQVAGEALVNVERHAAARQVEMSVRLTPDHVALVVSDDGGGIRGEDLERPGHFGIAGMRERLAAIGGTLAILPQPGGGTTVTATVPRAERLTGVPERGLASPDSSPVAAGVGHGQGGVGS